MIRRALLAMVFVMSGFAAGMVLTGHMRSASDAHASEPARPNTVQSPAGIVGMPDLSSVASRSIPSVMNISSLQVVRQVSPFTSDPLFRYFFGDDNYGPRNRVSQSLGSGVVVSPDGYILTNNHVVGDAAHTSVSVVLPDKRELKAKIVGTDEFTDLALLKIDAHAQPVLPWGDSSKLKVAEWVLAIGNPFQLNQTVTLGIVSALGRSLGGNLATYEDFIQTDAAINPGNSGGALVNARGELIGINTAIFSETGGYQGIGFAVPANLARQVVDDILAYGHVRRGWVGITRLADVTPAAARELGLTSTEGALVVELLRGSPADRAGLEPYDVVVALDGHPIVDAPQ